MEVFVSLGRSGLYRVKVTAVPRAPSREPADGKAITSGKVVREAEIDIRRLTCLLTSAPSETTLDPRYRTKSLSVRGVCEAIGCNNKQIIRAPRLAPNTEAINTAVACA